MNDNIDEIIEETFYDLKVLVTKTRNKKTGKVNLKAFETISDYKKEIVHVTDWRGWEIGNREVEFDMVVPKSFFDYDYNLVVAIQNRGELVDNSHLILQRYKFKTSEKELVTQHEVYELHFGLCADKIKTSGDIVVILCSRTSMISFFRFSDLSMITQHHAVREDVVRVTTLTSSRDKTVTTSYSDIGKYGFDLY